MKGLVVLTLLWTCNATASFGTQQRFRQSGESRRTHSRRKFQGAGGKLDCDGGLTWAGFSLGCTPSISEVTSKATELLEQRGLTAKGEKVEEPGSGFRLPTREEAAKIRENCTAPLASPGFPPWSAPLKIFAAKLWSEHHLIPLDVATRGFYTTDNKYFFDGKKHADLRFAAAPANDTSMKTQLRNLLAAFMRFADANKVHPWIAHGSLLGLTWNNAILDYDDDLDIQMAFGEMAKLKALDQTMIEKKYLLDVNPHYPYRRLREDSQNVIDARVTDVETGVFLDITALSSVSPGTPKRVACKSPHFLDVDWLFPLRRSLLEGVEVWIPADVTRVLASEYKAQGYGTGPYRGHYFNVLSRRWEKHTGGGKPPAGPLIPAS